MILTEQSPGHVLEQQQVALQLDLRPPARQRGRWTDNATAELPPGKLSTEAVAATVGVAAAAVVSLGTKSAKPGGREPLPAYLLSGPGGSNALGGPSGPPVAETVIGQDSRIRVPNNQVAAPPFASICRLEIIAPNQSTLLVGTGWMFGRSTVITAGHCVYCQNPAYGLGWVRQIRVTPQFIPGTTPAFSVPVPPSNYRTCDAWMSSANPVFDFGAIILPSPLPIPTLNIWAIPDPDLPLFGNYRLPGYPAESHFQGAMHYADGPVMGNGYNLTYMIDTSGGQSGCPVVVDGRNGKWYAIGIHNYGSAIGNQATRIAGEVYDMLANWYNLHG